MNNRVKFLALLSFLVCLSMANAADHYTFDKGHSRVFFEVNHLGFTDFNGMFREFEGGFSFDQNNVEESSVEVEVDLESVDAYHKKLNEHLRSEDFFNTKNYPIAHFISTKVKKVSEKQFKVYGNLSLNGKKKKVILDVTLNKLGVHPYSKKNIAGFSASTTIDRTDFNMGYGVPGIGKLVKLEFDIEGVRQK